MYGTARLAWVGCGILLLVLAGCKQKQEETAPTEAAGPSAASPVADTSAMLGLMPEAAVSGFVMPQPATVYERGAAFAVKIAPPETNMEQQLAENLSAVAAQAGAPEARTAAEILEAKGVNPHAPIAVFTDGAWLGDAGASMDFMNLVEIGSSVVDGSGEDTADASAPLPNSAKTTAVGILHCLDPDAAIETAETAFGVGAAASETVSASGQSIVWYAEPSVGHFMDDNRLVVGNSLDLLKGVADRLQTPDTVRISGPGSPESDPSAVVQVLRLDRMLARFGNAPEQLAVMNPLVSMADGENADDPTAFFGPDPLVMTVGVHEDRLEVAAFVDVAAHPGIADKVGSPTPLRLARMLPEDTVTMLALHFTPEWKEALSDTLLSGDSPLIDGDEGAKFAGIVGTVFGQLGDEIVLGIRGADGASAGAGLPHATALVTFNDPAQVKALLQLVEVPVSGGVTHNGFEVLQAPFNTPVPLHYSFVEDMLVVSTDTEHIKSVIDMQGSEPAGAFLSNLDPTFDTTIPRFGALVIRGDSLTRVVQPLTAFLGGMPPDMNATMAHFSETLREVRITQELSGSWFAQRMDIFLN
jgi:hypothetical protein